MEPNRLYSEIVDLHNNCTTPPLDDHEKNDISCHV